LFGKRQISQLLSEKILFDRFLLQKLVSVVFTAFYQKKQFISLFLISTASF